MALFPDGPMKNAAFLVALSVLSVPGLGGTPTAQAVVVKVKAGEFVVDHPTLINLGFEWVIQGADNRNAQVEVSYRKQGETLWKQGLPLLRLQGERIYQTDGVFNVISPNMFAGSILDLEPDTGYEARFVMSDPDGQVGLRGYRPWRGPAQRDRWFCRPSARSWRTEIWSSPTPLWSSTVTRREIRRC